MDANTQWQTCLISKRKSKAQTFCCEPLRRRMCFACFERYVPNYRGIILHKFICIHDLVPTSWGRIIYFVFWINLINECLKKRGFIANNETIAAKIMDSPKKTFK